MFKPTNLKFALLLSTWAHMLCWGQVAHSPSVGDLIDTAKQERAAKLLSSQTGMPSADLRLANKAPSSAYPASMPMASINPLLWSLTGTNQRLVAEIYFQGKVHVLYLAENDQRIGPWQVERFNTQGVWLVHQGARTKAAGQQLYLPAPRAGGSGAAFGFLAQTSSDSNLSSLQAASQLPLPVLGPQGGDKVNAAGFAK